MPIPNLDSIAETKPEYKVKLEPLDRWKSILSHLIDVILDHQI
ncbi:MAG TPA: hypothetical protein V6C65_27070 [Allocoleopsis sp.]